MINNSSAIAIDSGKIAGIAMQFTLFASVIGAAGAMPVQDAGLSIPTIQESAVSDRALAEWIKSNPEKREGLLEAIVVSDIEGASAGDTLPLDAQKLAERFFESLIASHAFAEQATQLVQKMGMFQPLSYSDGTRALARRVIQGQAGRADENIDEWASNLIGSMFKRS